MKTLEYKTSGTCSKSINLTLDDNNIITDVSFVGGCNGNLKGVCTLATGQSADEMIKKLKGITCGGKTTSCPDQLAKALEKAMA